MSLAEAFEGRGGKTVCVAAKAAGLGPVVAATYFTSQWDESIDAVHEAMGWLPPPQFRSPKQEEAAASEAAALELAAADAMAARSPPSIVEPAVSKPPAAAAKPVFLQQSAALEGSQPTVTMQKEPVPATGAGLGTLEGGVDSAPGSESSTSREPDSPAPTKALLPSEIEAQRKREFAKTLAPSKEVIDQQEAEEARRNEEVALAIEYRLALDRAREADKQASLNSAEAQATQLLQMVTVTVTRS
jgi:hypothetical protein